MNLSLLCCILLFILSYTQADNPPGVYQIDVEQQSLMLKIELKESTPEKPKFDIALMILALDSSESFLAKSCEGFSQKLNYDHFKLIPQEDNKEHDIFYNNLKVTGFTAATNVKLDEYWGLDSITVAKQCETKFTPYELNFGMIGLGYKENAAKNFKGSTKSFAIAEYEKHSTAFFKFAFNPDTTEAVRGIVLHTLKTDDNWHLSGKAQLAIKEQTKTEDQLTLIFDVKTLDFELPNTFFDFLWGQLSPIGLSQDGETKKYYFQGDWSALPKVTLNIGGQDHVISSEYYLHPFNQFELKKNNEKQEVRLLFAKGKKEDTIVVGVNYLMKFYTIFDTTDGNIRFYATESQIKDAKDEADRKAKEKEKEEEKQREDARKKAEKDEADRIAAEKAKEEQEARDRRNRILMWVGGIILLLVILGGVGYLVWQKKQAANLRNSIDGQTLLA